MDRLHIICGNCGCSDMFEWGYYRELYDITIDEPKFESGVLIKCRNCSTLHDLNDNADPKP